MFKSIRLKLTLYYSLVLLLALGVFGVTAYLYTGETLSENLNISLRSEVQWLREILEGRLKGERGKIRNFRKDLLNYAPQISDSTQQDEEQSEEQTEVWNKIYEHSLLNSKKQFIYIVDKRGRIFYRSFNLARDSLPSPPATKPFEVEITESKIGSQKIRLAALDTRFYKIRVAYPEDELTDVLQNLFSIFLYLIPIVLILSVIGGYFLAKQSLKPVHDITLTAQEITATNLRKRIAITNPNDELGRLAITLNSMIARLEESFEQVKQFSMDASHELRTPLTILRGEIEVALQGTRSTASYKKILASLLDEVVRMTSIVEGLILLAKADSGMATLSMKPVNFDKLIEEITEDAIVLAEQKQISVAVEKIEPVVVLGDEIRLRQMVLNLVDNAIKYTPEHGSIFISLERTDGTAKLTVRDTGIGIPEEELSRIFDRFYRVDKSRSRLPDGLGLGLSIAKWIAESHDGKIQAYSRPGTGSTFIVQLPAHG
ncbi:MAG: sensor histidine kinase [Candidatus Kryptoniota bacterium]